MSQDETQRVPAGWDEMRQRLLNRVFYEHDEAAVAASRDLLGEGFLDSMSVLVVLSLFDDEVGAGVAMQRARIPDTATLDAMGAFYRRLIAPP